MAASSTEQGLNPGGSRYCLPPAAESKTLEERVAILDHLISHYGAEVINRDELVRLYENCANPVCYDGFEPSGRMHIAQGLMKRNFVNAMTSSGFTFLFWVADWFAVLNLKLGGNLEDIKTVGRYMIEIWKACGMEMDRVRFLWASEEFDKFSDKYWSRVLDVSTHNTLTRITRCTQIMGRGEKGLAASQIFYPCMQAADIFFLGVDVCQLGLDQRKVNMLAREYADSVKLPKPSVLSHPMVPGLKKGQEKMSKSMPDTAIFMEDSPEDVQRKINKAFCPGHEDFLKEVEAGMAKKDADRTSVENMANPILAYFRLIIVDSLPAGSKIEVGNGAYANFEELRAAYLAGEVAPMELKVALNRYINELLEPVRRHFRDDPTAASLREQVIAITTAAAAKK